MKTIPSRTNKVWAVAHGRELDGDIVGTLNMDFNMKGVARPALLPIVLQTTTGSAQFGIPIAVTSDGSVYQVITTLGAWSVSNGSVFTRLLDSGNEPTIGVGGDAVRFNGNTVVSGTTTVHSHNGTTWTPQISSLANSAPHPLCVFENRNELAVGNANQVQTYNTSYSLQNTLILPAEYTVVWMRWRQNSLYIGTRNISGGGAKMFVWTGTGSSAQAAYGVQGSWIYSGTEYQSSIVVLSSSGQLLRFNNGGFDEIAHFPVYDTQYSWVSSSAPSSSIGKCSNRGMIASGDNLYINISGDLSRNGVDFPGNYMVEQPSGLWQFSPGIGLQHKAGYNYTGRQKLTVTAVLSNELSFGTNGHMAETGDAVFMDTVTGLTGVTVNLTYFAIKVSETSIKLALSPADALEARAVTVAGTPSTDKIAFNTYNSIGSLYQTTPGCVGLFQNTPFYDFYGTEVMFGGRCLNGSASNISTFMSLGLGRNVSSFITAPLRSDNVLDTFQKFFGFMEPLRQDSESILIKYRARAVYGLPTPVTFSTPSGLANWQTSSSFTIDTLVKDFQSVSIGDELTVLNGAAAGRTAHIVSLTPLPNLSTTLLVVIDESFPGIVPGYLSEVIADNWTKMTTDVDNTDKGNDIGLLEKNVDKTSTWIQFKFELRGKGIPIRLLQFINSTQRNLA